MALLKYLDWARAHTPHDRRECVYMCFSRMPLVGYPNELAENFLSMTRTRPLVTLPLPISFQYTHKSVVWSLV